MDILGSQLLVNTTEESHQQIVALLAMISREPERFTHPATEHGNWVYRLCEKAKTHPLSTAVTLLGSIASITALILWLIF